MKRRRCDNFKTCHLEIRILSNHIEIILHLLRPKYPSHMSYLLCICIHFVSSLHRNSIKHADCWQEAVTRCPAVSRECVCVCVPLKCRPLPTDWGFPGHLPQPADTHIGVVLKPTCLQMRWSIVNITTSVIDIVVMTLRHFVQCCCYWQLIMDNAGRQNSHGTQC